MTYLSKSQQEALRKLRTEIERLAELAERACESAGLENQSEKSMATLSRFSLVRRYQLRKQSKLSRELLSKLQSHCNHWTLKGGE